MANRWFDHSFIHTWSLCFLFISFKWNDMNSKGEHTHTHTHTLHTNVIAHSFVHLAIFWFGMVWFGLNWNLRSFRPNDRQWRWVGCAVRLLLGNCHSFQHSHSIWIYLSKAIDAGKQAFLSRNLLAWYIFYRIMNQNEKNVYNYEQSICNNQNSVV